jgi:hypothetical protein
MRVRAGLSGKNIIIFFPGGIPVKEKHSKYLRYGGYLLLVFLFLFAAYSFPGLNGKRDKLTQPVPAEQNISPQGEKAGKEAGESTMEKTEMQLFLGVQNGQIAIFARDSAGTMSLEKILPYPVKEVYYDELIQGIPFSTEEEMNNLLENFTS